MTVTASPPQILFPRLTMRMPRFFKNSRACVSGFQELEAQLKRQSVGATVQGSELKPQEAPPSQAFVHASGAQSQTGNETLAPTQSKPAKAEPFAFADFTWLNGNPRTKTPAFDSKFFTPEIRADVDYIYDFRHPKDDTISGSSEVFRANEVQLTQLGVGGDFHYDNVRARLMTQIGMYSQTTPRNDASPSRGQWNLDNLPLRYGSLRWISLQCFARYQCRCGNLPVLRGPVQLLQL